MRMLVALAPIALSLSSCGLPNFVEHNDKVLDTSVKTPWPETDIEAPSVKDIVNHIQCEVINEVAKLSDPKDPGSQPYQYLLEHGYVGAANLTLEVSDAESFTPQVTQFFPYALPGTNFALSVNGLANGTQHRTFNLLFPVYLEKKFDVPYSCLPYENQHSLHGSLQLGKLLAMGMIGVQATLREDQVNHPVTESSTAFAGFGTQIDFTVNWGIGGGPGYTIEHFHGPTPSTGLVNYGQTFKDTLLISFAPPKGPLCDAHNLPTGCIARNIAITPTAGPTPQELKVPDLTGKSASQMRAETYEFLNKAYAAALSAPKVTAVPSSSDAYSNAQQNNTQMLLQQVLPKIQ